MHGMCPMLLTVAAVVVARAAAVDCRTACLTCRLNEQPEAMLEIYCAMCQECKERRKDRLRAQLSGKHPTAQSVALFHKRPSNIQQLDNNIPYADPPPQNSTDEPGDNIYRPIPEGCPTAPPCSDEEKTTTPTTTTTATPTTTTTTTTPRPTCPHIKPCKKKVNTTLAPPPAPCYYLPPPPPPPCMMSVCAPPPPPPPICSAVPVYPPLIPQYPYMPPIPPTYAAYLAPRQPAPDPRVVEQVMSLVNLSDPKTTDGDYQYLYVGVPKTMLRRG